MEPKLTYSYSDISTYNRCQFLYQTTRSLGWETSDNTPKLIGDLVHVGISAHHRKLNPVVSMEEKLQERYVNSQYLDEEDLGSSLAIAKDLVRKACVILDREWETVDVVFQKMDLPLVEYKIRQDLRPLFETEFTGVIDWVAREKATGLIWIFDYKTRANIDSDISEDYNLQMAIYQKLLLDAGLQTVGSVCFQIRSAAMAKPKLNKDGSMSRSDLVCDWTSYVQALVEADLDPSDYLDMKVKLEAKKFFHFSRCYRSESLLNRIWNRVVIPTLYQMEQVRNPEFAAPRHMSSMCKTCSVVDRCQMDLRGVTGDYNIQFEE